ncbi:actin depolymerizing protein [Mycena rebaudengoi]|nr:actin depolymerizing protein [Mycena rebaudengoi]
MSATSGIGISQDLGARFGRAIEDRQTRFIKVSIQNVIPSQESLVHDKSLPIRGSLEEDLAQLEELLDDNTPAYLLAKLDDPPAEWLAIYYVPDTAKVRDKMLYASSRAALLRSLGSTLFSDSIFATTKSDLTAEAYAAHRRHLAAPQPLSAAERELVEVRAAERLAGGLSVYQGSRARTSHVSNTIGMPWTPDLEDAVKALGEGDDSVLVISTIDLATETVVLHSSTPTTPDAVGSSLPADGASYAFFAWKQPSRRDIVFIYACPSGSPVKHRMVYASGFNAVFLVAKNLLTDAPTQLLTRKIETSTPGEIDEAYLRAELDLQAGGGGGGGGGSGSGSGSGTSTPQSGAAFAKPRGPKRR